MNYLTTYYKNKAEQLQEQVNRLQFILENVAPQPTLMSVPELASDSDITFSPPSSSPPSRRESPHPSNGQGRGDGLTDGWKDPHKKGVDSEEWKRWIEKKGNYHRMNPYQYGTEKWYEWEWDYYENPPGP